MKLTYWGTAAAEGVPAAFCECENCRRSRLLGGRNLRGRSQALIDDRILIDFNADTFRNSLNYGVSLLKIPYLLVTHGHHDHWYPVELNNHAAHYSHRNGGEYPLTVFGTEPNVKAVADMIAAKPEAYEGRLSCRAVTPFEPFTIEKYTVTPLPAVHSAAPCVYMIEADSKALLYAHDTGIIPEETYAYWKKRGVRFDFVSLDCTEACREMKYTGHMNLTRNVLVREEMRAAGVADEHTVFCCNHFSHNGVNACYEDFLPIAMKEGFLVSYDGMQVEI